jgi:hypothetical protein
MSEPVTYTLKEGDREVEAIRHIISLLDVLRPAERVLHREPAGHAARDAQRLR